MRCGPTMYKNTMRKKQSNNLNFATFAKTGFWVSISACCLHPNLSHSQGMSDAQRNLQQLDHKIAVIQKDLTHSHTQQAQFQRELSATDKIIKENEQTLHSIQQKISIKKTKILPIQQQVKESSQQYAHLQALLLQQVQARYKQPPNPPLAWLLNSTQKKDIDRLLTYYQYTIHANKQLLQQLKITQVTLQQAQHALQREIATLHHMQNQAQIAQHQLELHKNHYQTLVYSLHQHVLTQETSLGQYERNRDNLSKILHKLNQESVIRTHRAMSSMKQKLPNPINVETDHIHTLHQGIMLYGMEGMPVHAVYPGKVVFCEWLNGYGLLLIVDHGWGLMTLYANNHTLLKHMGDTVNQGEQIATIGHGGISKQPGLYFEVRKNGKAISPLDWLART